MRESNFKNIALNKAAVSITTNLYDRRALDSTMDQPLVNSLNHLTFLTSSSAKVRETLANDGGLERLVCILHECHKDAQTLSDTVKSVEIEKMNALIAWKWTLAFQCLVLVATRGTERIRKCVVEAGVLPIISTVLDNYLLFVRNFDNDIDDNLNEKFLSIVAGKLQKMKHQTPAKTLKLDTNDSKDYDYFNIRNYLSSDCRISKCLNQYLCLKNNNDTAEDDPLEVNENIIKQNMHSINATITCPRSFLNGRLIPKDDDVVWSLQLLAFTSKYSNLKSFFQCTNLVDSLSLRVLVDTPEEEDEAGFDEKDDFDIDSENQEEIEPEVFRQDNEELNIDDYEMIYMDPHKSSLRSTQDSSQSTQTFSQSFSQPLTQQIMQNAQSSLPPTMQAFSQTYSQPSTQAPSLLMTKHSSCENVDEETLIPILSKTLSKGQSSSTSTSSSIYGTSILDDESVNASTLPSAICEGKTDFHLSKVCNDPVRLQEPRVSIFQNATFNDNISTGLVDSIINLENCLNDENEENYQDTLSNLIEVCEKLNNYYEKSLTSHQIRSINESKLATRRHSNTYNYETYFTSKCNDADLEQLPSAILPNFANSPKKGCFKLPSKFMRKVNLFPLVEKFTMKSINTQDMCYWAGVVMRNSCRKDEQRGGVRQCAYHGCGKWETCPREFAKCRRCKRTKYCSKNCQLKAWGYHKHWCVDSSPASSSSANTGNATTVPNSSVGAPTPDTGDMTNNSGTATSDILESVIDPNRGTQFINRLDGEVSEEN